MTVDGRTGSAGAKRREAFPRPDTREVKRAIATAISTDGVIRTDSGMGGVIMQDSVREGVNTNATDTGTEEMAITRAGSGMEGAARRLPLSPQA